MEDFKEEAPDGCLYDVLGVERTSSSSEIRSAYRKLAMKWHPDKCSSSLEEQQAKDKFQGIQEAYSVLSDDKKRVLYDSGLYDGGEDEGMQSFMTEMVSMMSANTSKCSFGELKTMFDQMVDSYAFPSFSGPSSNASSDNSCSTSNVKPEETSASSEQLFGHFTSQSFCMGQQDASADNVNRQKLHKKHRRRKTPYEQGPRASTYNKVD